MNLDGFIPWFLSEVLLPNLLWIVGAVVVVSAVLWITIVIIGQNILRRRRRSAWRP